MLLRAAETGFGSASGAALADVLLESVVLMSDEAPAGLRIFDRHTHLGLDPDGSRQTGDELCGAVDVVGGDAVVFSLSELGGYGAANDRVLAAAEASGGRLVAFCRVDPHGDGLAEVRRVLERGAAEIKLHPPAERFSPATGIGRWSSPRSRSGPR
jgi:hypothetical protein